MSSAMGFPLSFFVYRASRGAGPDVKPVPHRCNFGAPAMPEAMLPEPPPALLWWLHSCRVGSISIHVSLRRRGHRARLPAPAAAKPDLPAPLDGHAALQLRGLDPVGRGRLA